MNLKRLIPGVVKQEGKYLLYKLLKIPYNRAGVPIEVVNFLSNKKPINFVDVGASEGKFASMVNKHYKINAAILIEPLGHLGPVLSERFKAYRQIHIESLVISPTTGHVPFYHSEDASVLSSLLEVKDGFFDAHLSEPVKISLPSDTLDNVVQKYDLPVVDLLKIDVQGAEHLVLLSGVETLKRTRFVYTEFSYKAMYEGSSTFSDLFDLFNAHDFRLLSTRTNWTNPDGEMIQGDALFANNKIQP